VVGDPPHPSAKHGGDSMRLRIAGVDEAGRGPLAGPVVAAAVILHPGRPIPGVADSKVLTAATRARLNLAIRRRALCFGIGWADPAEIDALNILHATFLAMRRAVLAMTLCPDMLLVDGNRLPLLGGLGGALRARAIIGGDATEAAISAASILAKTARDQYMNHIDTIYPEYAFATHKGYATALHRRRLATHGPCPLHRRSFAPVLSSLEPPAEWQADFEWDPEHEPELDAAELDAAELDGGELEANLAESLPER
jgi:ribonuclease HII